MVEIKGYLTNLGKYNEGEMVGTWLSFPASEEDIETAFNEIGINEEYEEYFFTDWDCSFNHGFSEYECIEAVNEYAELIEEWDEDTFCAACEVWGFNDVIEADPNDYSLYEDINDDYDLGYYWAVESGCYNLKDMGPLADYIDYESFGRDIRFESDGGFSFNGWIEYRG